MQILCNVNSICIPDTWLRAYSPHSLRSAFNVSVTYSLWSVRTWTGGTSTLDLGAICLSRGLISPPGRWRTCPWKPLLLYWTPWAGRWTSPRPWLSWRTHRRLSHANGWTGGTDICSCVFWDNAHALLDGEPRCPHGFPVPTVLWESMCYYRHAFLFLWRLNYSWNRLWSSDSDSVSFTTYSVFCLVQLTGQLKDWVCSLFVTRDCSSSTLLTLWQYASDSFLFQLVYILAFVKEVIYFKDVLFKLWQNLGDTVKDVLFSTAALSDTH